MEAIGGGGFGGWNWDLNNLNNNSKTKNKKPFHKKNCKSNAASDSAGGGGSGGYQFPFKQAATAGSLALTGDTIAQITQRLRKNKENSNSSSVELNDDMHLIRTILSDHDWLRALRMSSYGFFLYGPGSYAWYQYLDRCLPQQSVKNLMLKVLLNQIVLGPCVVAVVFAWNNLWLGKVSQLPAKYQKDAVPTLLYGFRFWIPVSVLNFSVVPLQARVAFMSMGSIFWNFCLSSTMSK